MPASSFVPLASRKAARKAAKSEGGDDKSVKPPSRILRKFKEFRSSESNTTIKKTVVYKETRIKRSESSLDNDSICSELLRREVESGKFQRIDDEDVFANENPHIATMVRSLRDDNMLLRQLADINARIQRMGEERVEDRAEMRKLNQEVSKLKAEDTNKSRQIKKLQTTLDRQNGNLLDEINELKYVERCAAKIRRRVYAVHRRDQEGVQSQDNWNLIHNGNFASHGGDSYLDSKYLEDEDEKRLFRKAYYFTHSEIRGVHKRIRIGTPERWENVEPVMDIINSRAYLYFRDELPEGSEQAYACLVAAVRKHIKYPSNQKEEIRIACENAKKALGIEHPGACK